MDVKLQKSSLSKPSSVAAGHGQVFTTTGKDEQKLTIAIKKKLITLNCILQQKQHIFKNNPTSLDTVNLSFKWTNRYIKHVKELLVI